MALDCVIDYIGLALCPGDGAYDQPPSGIYITSLPGISLESIDKIANQEQTTYLGVWADIQKSAADQFKVDVMQELNACYQLNRECDFQTLICENMDVLTQAWKYLLGIWVMLFRINTNRLNYYTTVTSEQANELKDFYYGEYVKALKQGVLLMDTEGCELCCGGNPEVVTWLP